MACSPPSRHPSKHPVKPGLRAERGFALIEVMVSAMLVALIAVGVFAGIDGPGSVAGTDQARAIAASLAQQDQDRLRALPSNTLASYSAGPRSVAEGDVTYTVASSAQWVADSRSPSSSCTSVPTSADYLRITSTVTWPSLGSGQPVSVSSLVAPPASSVTSRGNIVVQLQDQAANPVTGVPVTITDTKTNQNTGPVATDASGCAFFGYLPTDTFNASFQKTGYVDWNGSSAPTITGLTAPLGATSLKTYPYAQASQANVSFVDSNNKPVSTQSVTFNNPSLATGALTPFTVGGATSKTITGLFPFTTGYSVYAGGCTADDPGSSNRATIAVTPGGSSPVTVIEPDLQLVISGTFGQAFTLYYTPTATPPATCSERYSIAIPANYPSGNGSPNGNYVGNSGAGTMTVNMPLPYGTYSVCGQWGNSHYNNGTLSNMAAAGSSYPVSVSMGGLTQGPCP